MVAMTHQKNANNKNASITVIAMIISIAHLILAVMEYVLI
jgi:hypothetical protein